LTQRYDRFARLLRQASDRSDGPSIFKPPICNGGIKLGMYGRSADTDNKVDYRLFNE
jgi:hypothetical protein